MVRAGRIGRFDPFRHSQRIVCCSAQSPIHDPAIRSSITCWGDCSTITECGWSHYLSAITFVGVEKGMLLLPKLVIVAPLAALKSPKAAFSVVVTWLRYTRVGSPLARMPPPALSTMVELRTMPRASEVNPFTDMEMPTAAPHKHSPAVLGYRPLDEAFAASDRGGAQ